MKKIRFSEEEYLKLKKAADEQGLTIDELILHVIHEMTSQ